MIKSLYKTATSDFYKRLAITAIPSTVQFLLTSSRHLIDTIMIGQLGEESVAAVGAAGKPFFVMIVILWAASHSAGILASQYWGKKDIIGVRKSVIQAVIFSLILALPIFFLFRFWPECVVRLAVKSHEVAELGQNYLSIVSINLFALSVTFSMYAGLRSINQAYKSMIFGAISMIINVGFNYLLIFGKCGFPELGLKGAAIATLISAFSEATLMLVFLYSTNHTLGAKLEALKKAFDYSDFKHFAKIAYPMVINGLVWSIGVYIYFIIYGRMGPKQLAVMTLVSPLENLCIAFFAGIYTAAGVMLGHHLGRRDFEIAWKESWVFVALGFTMGIILCIFLFLVQENFFGFFKSMESSTLIMAKGVYIVFLVSILCKSINTVVINGVIRSGGDTRFILLLDAGCQWLVGIPLGFMGAFFWRLPLKFVFLLVICEEIVKIFICLARMYSRAWIRNLVDMPEQKASVV